MGVRSALAVPTYPPFLPEQAKEPFFDVPPGTVVRVQLRRVATPTGVGRALYWVGRDGLALHQLTDLPGVVEDLQRTARPDNAGTDIPENRAPNGRVAVAEGVQARDAALSAAVDHGRAEPLPELRWIPVGPEVASFANDRRERQEPNAPRRLDEGRDRELPSQCDEGPFADLAVDLNGLPRLNQGQDRHAGDEGVRVVASAKGSLEDAVRLGLVATLREAAAEGLRLEGEARLAASTAAAMIAARS